MLKSEEKQKLVSKFKISEKDCGSSAVQVALLTARINELTTHFGTHKKDHCSRHGLLEMVGQRRRLLHYLRNTDAKQYQSLIKELGIRK